MTTNAIQSSHIYSTYFAPRGRSRIYTLGMQIAQLYLSPFDQIIGFIGEAGSGKSVLIKGMFPGIVRPFTCSKISVFSPFCRRTAAGKSSQPASSRFRTSGTKTRSPGV